MKKTTSIIILAAAVGLALPAMADPHKGSEKGRDMMRPESHFMLMDENKDRAISREEFEKGQNERFSQADKNGDGNVTYKEFSKFLETERERRREVREQKMFNKLDNDGDGLISKEETTAHSQQMFERMDRNDDGKIDAADRPKKRPRGEGRGDGMGMMAPDDN